MAVQLDLPREVVEAAGDSLQRDVLEGLLLKLVSEGRLGKAGSLLNMSRWEAIRWYAGHGLPYLAREDLESELRFALQD